MRATHKSRWTALAGVGLILPTIAMVLPASANPGCDPTGRVCVPDYVGVSLLGGDSTAMVAVSDTGNAYGSSPPLVPYGVPSVAVSGTGYAYGGIAVSATGRAEGMHGVSGEAYLMFTGMLDAPVNAEQAELAAQGLVVRDPAALADKLQVMADTATHVATNMALHATTPDSASTSMRSNSSVPPANALNTPYRSQDKWYYCVPASVSMWMDSWGRGGVHQDEWARVLRTNHAKDNKDKTAGTPIENAVGVINSNKSHRDDVYFVKADEQAELMNLLTTDVHHYGHGSLVSIKTSAAKWWSNKGSPDSKHAILLHGYDHRSAGSIWLMDPYDYTRFNWNEKSFGGPNPGGSKKIRLSEVWAAHDAAGGKMVW